MSRVYNLNAQELKNSLDSNENILLVDCRELPEWQSEHIKGAQHIPMSTFANNYHPILTDKTQKIVVQCRSGGRSYQVAMFLASQGFTNIHNLEGGILEWINQEFPVEK